MSTNTDEVGLSKSVLEALEMGCDVTVETEGGSVTFVAPLGGLIRRLDGEVSGDTVFGFYDTTILDKMDELSDPKEPEQPPALEAEVEIDDHAGDPELQTMTARFSECSVEAGGSALDTLAVTYRDSQTVDVITQLLSVVEAITNRAAARGVVPVDFEGMVRGIVDDFDSEDATDACSG